MKNTTIRNGNLFCLNCGGEFKLNMPIAVDEMGKKIKAFDKLHADCLETWKEPEPDKSASIAIRAQEWWTHGERGISSESIFTCCLEISNGRMGYPCDPSDFKRCYKLFQFIPEWKEKPYSDMIAGMSPQWSKLMRNWDTLTEMYEENVRTNWTDYKRIGMYEFMQECIK